MQGAGILDFNLINQIKIKIKIKINSYIDSNLISFNRFVVYCIIASNQFSFWKYQYVALQIARKNNYILRWLNLKMNSALLKKKIQKITVKNSVKSKEKLIFSWSFQGQKSAVWLLFIIQISNVIPNLNDFLCCTSFAIKYFLILCCYLKKFLRFSYQIIFSLFLFLSICILLSLSYKISSKKCIVSPFTHLQIAGTHSTVGKKIQKKFAGQNKVFVPARFTVPAMHSLSRVGQIFL